MSSTSMANTPIAHCPISPTPPSEARAGWMVSTRQPAEHLTLTDLSPIAKVTVQAPWNGVTAGALRVPMGRAARDDDGVLVIGSAPGQWHALGGVGNSGELAELMRQQLDRLAADELVTVLDVTHGRAMLRLTGSHAANLLAKVCAVDFADSITPNGAAFRASVARLVTDVVRDDQQRQLSYLLHCERSSGQYLFDVLADAGAEFDIDIGEFAPPGI